MKRILIIILISLISLIIYFYIIGSSAYKYDSSLSDFYYWPSDDRIVGEYCIDSMSKDKLNRHNSVFISPRHSIIINRDRSFYISDIDPFFDINGISDSLTSCGGKWSYSTLHFRHFFLDLNSIRCSDSRFSFFRSFVIKKRNEYTYLILEYNDNNSNDFILYKKKL